MALRCLVFLGSARQSIPPRPARLGARVASACVRQLERMSAEVELIDPLAFDLGAVFKPHFSHAECQAPPALEALAQKIERAESYVMVSPEYNHSMSPALTHLLNHFGASRFAFKPSAIVTYSAGQWGGVRAAVGMRAYLSELGCLPVSAMVHVPKAHDVFDEDGQLAAGEDAARWDTYFGRTFAQLAWWARAAKAERALGDPAEASPAFLSTPAQRNAP